MKRLLLLLVLLLLPKTVWAKCEDNPMDCFTIDKDGKVHTDDGKAERTFGLNAVKTGFIIDAIKPSVEVHLSMEIVKWKDFYLDGGLAHGRVFAAIGYELVPVIKIGVDLWAGYNLLDNAPAAGIGVDILEF